MAGVPPRIAGRIERVRAALGAAEIDGLLVSTPEHFAYLSGFMAFDRAGYLLLTAHDALLLTSPLYAGAALDAAPGWEILDLPLRTLRPEAATTDRLRGLGLRRLGFERADLTVARLEAFQTLFGEGVELVGVGGLVEAVRAVKDEAEIAAIGESVRLTDVAFTHLCGWLQPGVTERRAAWEVERHMREAGADGVAFEVIVAAGPHAAVPHHRPSDRPIQAGEPIILDVGARRDGYNADLTRTLWLGPPTAEYRTRWEAVARANAAMCAGVRPGMTGQQADALAREVLEAAGLGAAFTHPAGHGVGLGIHEDPFVGKDYASTVLQIGQTLTVEPGVYFAGWGGIRIEDMGVLRAAGLKVLTRASKPMTL